MDYASSYCRIWNRQRKRFTLVVCITVVNPFACWCAGEVENNFDKLAD